MCEVRRDQWLRSQLPSMIRASLYTFSFTAEMDSNSITIKRNSSLDHKQHTTFLVQMSNANYSISRSIQLSIYVGMSDCQEDQKDQSQSIKFENLLHSSKSWISFEQSSLCWQQLQMIIRWKLQLMWEGKPLMTGFQSLPQGMPNGGTLPSTMLLPWFVLVSLAFPMLWLILDGMLLSFDSLRIIHPCLTKQLEE